MSGGEKETIDRLSIAAARLLEWFPDAARPLPWREPGPAAGQIRDPAEGTGSVPLRDPYRVWVSEIMLQQTRIEAVRAPYARFMAQFPDIASLAAAPEDEVLKAWEGLGYYSRARNLHKAAKICAERYGGQLPASYEALRKLPGLGEYTAGAVASIAFGERVPAVDGNVLRILARLLLDRRDVLDGAVRREMSSRMAALARSVNSAGLLNEALMELGETLCLPAAQPLCGKCPVKDLCLAHAAGCEEQLPLRRKTGTRRVEERTVLLLCAEGRVALRRRPEEGLLAGMYEFPALDGFVGEDKLPDRLRESFGLGPERILSVQALPPARHLFTHVEWRMQGFRVDLKPGETSLLFVSPEELELGYALPSAFSRYRGCLRQGKHLPEKT